LQSQRIIVTGNGNHAGAFEPNVEQAAGQDSGHPFHHFDVVAIRYQAG